MAYREQTEHFLDVALKMQLLPHGSIDLNKFYFTLRF